MSEYDPDCTPSPATEDETMGIFDEFNNIVGTQCQSSRSCKFIDVLATAYMTSIKSVYCFVNKCSTSVITQANGSQSIIIEAGPNSVIMCPGKINITQKMSIRMISKTLIQNSIMIPQIADTIKGNVQKALEDLKKDDAEINAIPNTKTYITEIIKKMNLDTFTKSVNDMTTDILMQASGSQVITLKLGAGTVLSADQCTLSENMIIKIVSQSVVTSYINKVAEMPEFQKIVDIQNEYTAIVDGLDFQSKMAIEQFAWSVGMTVLLSLVIVGLPFFMLWCSKTLNFVWIPLAVCYVTMLVLAVYGVANSQRKCKILLQAK